MRVNPLWEAFNAGELSPWLISRTSFDKYPFGLETCENIIPFMEGAAVRRPGLRFVAATKDSTKTTRLARFEFSTVQAYILEFGDGYIRFCRHQGQIQTSGVSAWATGTAYSVGSLVTNGGTTYYCITAHTAGATFAGDAAKWYAQTGTIYEIPSPYAEADLSGLNFRQSADLLYIFHPDYQTRKLTRTGHTSWIMEEVVWFNGPYLDQNITTTTLTPSAATGTITITASAVTGINDGQGFLSTDVGRLVRISNPVSGTNWGFAQISVVTNTTTVTAVVKRDFNTTSASADWILGAWSGTTGYPSVAVFYQGRFVMAATGANPQTIWFSQSDDFENMSPDSENSTGVWDGTVEDDDAVTRTIGAGEVSSILWMAPLRQLVIGTVGGEWVTSTDGAIVKPSDLAIDRHTKIGSSDVPAVIVGNRILFLQRAKRKLIEIGFSFEDDSFRDADMTRLSRHITASGISRIAYAQEPHKLICCVRADGEMACVSYNRAENVVGWFRVVTDGAIEDVETIPGDNGAGQVQDSTGRDEVWVTVNRTINGSAARYIEVFERDFENGHDQEDAYYSDSLVTYDGVATDTITGIDHLEGETVVVWADGARQGDKTVASGAITLDQEATVVQVGLPYTHKLKTLKAAFGGQAGTAISKDKRIHALTFILLNSHTIKYGPNETDLTEIDFREVEDAMDTAVPLFTGEYDVDFDGDWGLDSRVYIEDDAPAPFTLLAIAPEMRTNDIV